MDYSTQSFERLYKENYRLMYRFAYSMLTDAEDARDAVSQVFTLVWQFKPGIQEGAERGYLLQATRNQCLHLLRRQGLRLEVEETLRQETPDTTNPEQGELLTQLRKAIREQLTEQDRRILELHYDREMTYSETAEELGISTAAVNKHISRSLSRLRQWLRR